MTQENADSAGSGIDRIRSPSRRSFLKIGAGVVAGAAIASVAGVPFANGAPSSQESAKSSDGLKASLDAATSQVSFLQERLNTANSSLATLQSRLTTLQTQSTDLQTQLDTMTGFITLSYTEQPLIEAIAETLIPSDSNGAGAKEAGVIYFIDRQLATDYGKSAHMYMQGPFVMPGQSGPITVDGISYSEGSMPVTIVSGMQYQYHMNLREFWRYGLDAFETYCNNAYGGDFETLSASDAVAALTDLFNNKPSTFNDIIPSDFVYEVFFMVWAGFTMDPLYGGNQNMVSWTFSGFNGVNLGNFYGEGLTQKDLMVATTSTRLQPASLAQYQKGSP